MELLKIATKLFLKTPDLRKSDLQFEPTLKGLSQLLPAYANDFDLQSLVNFMSNSGFSGQVDSWISKGKNLPLTKIQVVDLLGCDKVYSFAGELRIDPSLAAEGLSHMIPQLVDKQSIDGVLYTSPISQNAFLKFIERYMGAA
ncbi:MAG: hypothetical protein KTR17_09595 [Cellvibrionaceae bacterium]|nr:hypothetical protein [Cellvibrionaceae bacterium]